MSQTQGIFCLAFLMVGVQGLRITNYEGSKQDCKTVVLTTWFTKFTDVVHHKDYAGDKELKGLEAFRRSFSTIPEGQLEVILLHDGLPEESMKGKQSSNFKFQKVDTSGLDQKLGANDVRFLVVEDLIRSHPEWNVVFLTDASDVKFHHNPCVQVNENPTKLFLGSETPEGYQKPYQWTHQVMERGMGSKYLEVWEENRKSVPYMYNAGISGGTRDVYLKFLAHMNKLFRDPELPCKREPFKYAQGNPHPCNVNMAVFNYVATGDYDKDDIVTGYPLHSRMFHSEDNTDAAIQHK
jgi:hypothetical protein